jgi:CheY-like chemotaxis protein
MTACPHVLIVEDNYVLLDVLTAVGERNGVKVVAASSGEDALTILRRRGSEIACLLTDINLPGLIDGWTVAEAYRALHPDRPVVYASAAEPDGRNAVPGSVFLRKPFQLQEIVALSRMMTETAGSLPMEVAG